MFTWYYDTHSDTAVTSGARLTLCAKVREVRCAALCGAEVANRMPVVSEQSGHLASGRSSELNLQAFLLNGENTLQVTSQLKLSHLQENHLVAHTVPKNKDVKHRA